MDPGAQPHVRRPEETRVERGGVLQQVVALRRLDGPARPDEELPDVHADQRRRQQAHGREDAEASAHIRGHVERGDPLPAGQLAQRAAGRIGGEDEVAARRLAERLVEPRADDEVLRHRLRRAARLADDVDQHAARVDPAEHRAHRGRVHVLEHGEARIELARLVVELVPGRRLERVENRLGAEGGPADAEHQHVVVRLAHALGEGIDRLDGRFLVGQPLEGVLARGAPGAHVSLHRREAPRQLAEARPGEAALAIDAPVEAILEHPSKLQPDHDASTMRPS